MVNIEQQDGPTGPWQKTPLYTKLEDTSIALAKLYNQRDQEQRGKTNIYKYHHSKHEPGSKVYEEKDKSKIPIPESNLKNGASRDLLKNGSTQSKVFYSLCLFCFFNRDMRKRCLALVVNISIEPSL
jgi:hypothetical protein